MISLLFKKGIVTNTELAPTYATLVMTHLKIDLYSQVKNHFGTEIMSNQTGWDFLMMGLLFGQNLLEISKCSLKY